MLPKTVGSPVWRSPLGAGYPPAGGIVKIRAFTIRLLDQLAFNILPNLLRALHPPAAGTGFKSDTHYCVTILDVYCCTSKRYNFKQQTLLPQFL